MDTGLFRLTVGALAIVAAGAVCVSVSGQQPQPPQATGTQQKQEPRPVFRAGANLVRVDVTVSTKHGEPVTNLQADDFILSEDGYPQEIQAFQFVRLNGQPDDDRELDIRSPQHAAYEASRDDVRVFLIFWDEYHIGEFIPAIRGRETLSYFVKHAFGPTDLVGIMDQLTTVDSIRFTRDWNALAGQVKAFRGRFGIFFPTRSPIEEAQIRMGSDVNRVRNQITLSALQSAAAYMGNFREGRKVILFVSQGVTIFGRNSEADEFRQLVQTANQNNVAIYTLDPGSEVGRRPGSLLSIADETGGKAFVGSNAPGTQLPQLVKDSSAFYLMGYVSSRDPGDGKFHKINVRMKKPAGYELRGRTGYFAPAKEAIEKAREAAAKAVLPPSMEREIGAFESGTRHERSADVWVGMTRGVEGRTRVTIAWLPRPASAQPPRPTAASLTLDVKGPDGTLLFNATDDTSRLLSFEAPPGELSVKASARNAKGEEIDGEIKRLAVPSFAGDRVALGSPFVYCARTAIDTRRIQEGQNLRPEVGREFERTDRLFIRFALYGTAAPIAHLMTRQNVTMRELQLTALPSGEYQIDLPLAAIARGDYIISIDASGGDESAREFVAFRIR